MERPEYRCKASGLSGLAFKSLRMDLKALLATELLGPTELAAREDTGGSEEGLVLIICGAPINVVS